MKARSQEGVKFSEAPEIRGETTPTNEEGKAWGKKSMRRLAITDDERARVRLVANNLRKTGVRLLKFMMEHREGDETEYWRTTELADYLGAYADNIRANIRRLVNAGALEVHTSAEIDGHKALVKMGNVDIANKILKYHLKFVTPKIARALTPLLEYPISLLLSSSEFAQQCEYYGLTPEEGVDALSHYNMCKSAEGGESIVRLR